MPIQPALTLVPPFGRRYAGAAHQRRRPVGLADFVRKGASRLKAQTDQRIARELPEQVPCSQLSLAFAQKLLDITCVLPTWWLWRSGCTRSHSELGREMLQRQWYFVLRRGRVGRCQVYKTHVNSSLFVLARQSGTRAAQAALSYGGQDKAGTKPRLKLRVTRVEQPVRPPVDPADRLLDGPTSSGYA